MLQVQPKKERRKEGRKEGREERRNPASLVSMLFGTRRYEPVVDEPNVFTCSTGNKTALTGSQISWEEQKEKKKKTIIEQFLCIRHCSKFVPIVTTLGSR